MPTRAVHYVGFRGDEYVRAHRIWGGPVIIHKDYYDRVFTEVGDDDVVIFGPKYKKVSFSNPGHAINLAKKLNDLFNCTEFTVVKLSSGETVDTD